MAHGAAPHCPLGSASLLPSGRGCCFPGAMAMASSRTWPFPCCSLLASALWFLYPCKPWYLVYIGDSPVLSAVASLWLQAIAGTVQPWVTVGFSDSTTVTRESCSVQTQKPGHLCQMRYQEWSQGVAPCSSVSGLLHGVRDRGCKSHGGL